jgi:hypothetical protein
VRDRGDKTRDLLVKRHRMAVERKNGKANASNYSRR